MRRTFDGGDVTFGGRPEVLLVGAWGGLPRNDVEVSGRGMMCDSWVSAISRTDVGDQ